MEAQNLDLHGNVPDKSRVALLLIDVINSFNFPEADQLIKYAEPMAKKIAALKERCREERIPTIYVNDNFGIWRSDFKHVLMHCLDEKSKGQKLAQILKPSDDDYFVLKPKHSGFFSTTLDILLKYLKTEIVILTGIAGNICVLFTANDAYMRDLRLVVPPDCIASNTKEENEHALELMSKTLKAELIESSKIPLQQLKKHTP
ncbi:MAG TPA: isochorismatase family cysteine hydrolase [Oculatellaceae cyanobacterium]